MYRFRNVSLQRVLHTPQLQNVIAEVSRFGNWNPFRIANPELGHLFKTELHCEPVDDIYSIQLGHLYIAVL